MGAGGQSQSRSSSWTSPARSPLESNERVAAASPAPAAPAAGPSFPAPPIHQPGPASRGSDAAADTSRERQSAGPEDAG
jgi:hypothetical protein